jgi:glutamate synthase domain-containing protein 2
MRLETSQGRPAFYFFSVASLLAVGWVGFYSWQPMLFAYIVVVPLALLGFYDVLQTKRSILRNYPVVGHIRYIFEAIRPEMQQYFIEQNLEGRPLNREERSVVYARAKRQLSTLPFGTHKDVYDVGYEWMNHSIMPKPKIKDQPLVTIGGPDCKQPYDCSLLNISAMSFGSMSRNAIHALSKGAAKGGFFHNTGEGGVSPYHLEGGGDLCWQIGTGYFGCRNDDGTFNDELFKKTATLDNVKLIEIKLSQGAKPGKGGILPAAKITEEIARIRKVPMGQDVISPPFHKEFNTPTGLLDFVKRLRKLSGGKPIGFKLCVGKRREFFAICKAMLETGILPDFITVDGGEGGTGAAPLEFSNSVGTPLIEGLVTVQNALVGFGLRDKIKVIASGRVLTGFGMAKRGAGGAGFGA